jgi:hypothetical protein
VGEVLAIDASIAARGASGACRGLQGMSEHSGPTPSDAVVCRDAQVIVNAFRKPGYAETDEPEV